MLLTVTMLLANDTTIVIIFAFWCFAKIDEICKYFSYLYNTRKSD